MKKEPNVTPIEIFGLDGKAFSPPKYYDIYEFTDKMFLLACCGRPCNEGSVQTHCKYCAAGRDMFGETGNSKKATRRLR